MKGSKIFLKKKNSRNENILDIRFFVTEKKKKKHQHDRECYKNLS